MIAPRRVFQSILAATFITVSANLSAAQTPAPVPSSRIPSCETFEAYGQQADGPLGSYELQFKQYLHPWIMSDFQIGALNDAITACLLTRTLPFGPHNLNNARTLLQNLKRLRDAHLAAAGAGAAQNSANMSLLQALADEVDRMPPGSASIARLAEIRKQIQTIRISTNTPQSFIEAQFKLQTKIEEKSESLRRVALADLKLQFSSAAQAAADKHGSVIARIGFPTKVLDATVFFGQGRDENKKFITLRQLLGLLLDRDGYLISGAEDGGQYGVSVKRAGERRLAFVFQLDGQDLFLDSIVVGDLEQPLATWLKRSQAEKMLRDLVNASMWQ